MFHRLELRLERLDTEMDHLEKPLAAVQSEMRAMREDLETRLHRPSDALALTLPALSRELQVWRYGRWLGSTMACDTRLLNWLRK
jgi:hypothetical protein